MYFKYILINEQLEHLFPKIYKKQGGSSGREHECSSKLGKKSVFHHGRLFDSPMVGTKDSLCIRMIIYLLNQSPCTQTED